MQLVKGDIQSADLIGHLLTQHNIDTVMHFAAQVSPLNSPCQSYVVQLWWFQRFCIRPSKAFNATLVDDIQESAALTITAGIFGSKCRRGLKKCHLKAALLGSICKQKCNELRTDCLCLCADTCRQLIWQQSGLYHEQHIRHTCAPRGLPRIRRHPPLCSCVYR